MPVLDREKIINGTDRKRLVHGYENLKEKAGYSDADARAYRECYVNKPLSFLLENARYIVTEPAYGLPFMEWVMCRVPVPADDINTVCDVVEEYVTTNGDKMSSKMLSKYKSFQESLNHVVETRAHEIPVESILLGEMKEKDVSDFYDATCGEICSSYIERQDPDAMKAFEGFSPWKRQDEYRDYVSESVPSMVQIMTLIPYARVINVEPVLYESARKVFNVDNDSIQSISDNLVAVESFQSLCRSEAFLEGVKTLRNMNLRILTESAIATDIGKVILESYNKFTEDAVCVVYDTPHSAVNALFDESVYDDLYKEDREKTRTDLLNMKHAVYEAARKEVAAEYEISDDNDIITATPFVNTVIESFGLDPETVTVEQGLKVLTEAVAEVEAAMEDSSFFEYATTGKMNKVIEKKHGAIREEDAPKKDKKKPSEDEDDDTIPDSARVSSSLPDSSNPKSKKPEKPKSGVIDKVQNKAMDVHSKSRKAAANVRKVGTGVKNAATAVLKIPAGVLQGIKDLGQKFEELDDDRRKKLMLKPGYRKKLFKNLRVAATYGAAGYVHPLLIPVTWFGRKLSKEKNKYIRQEFARELEAEIKVCDAKIEDAASAGDQKQRYQLIRIRDKYAQERDRVAANGKYI